MSIREIASTIEELSYDARTIDSIQQVFFKQSFVERQRQNPLIGLLMLLES